MTYLAIGIVQVFLLWCTYEVGYDSGWEAHYKSIHRSVPSAEETDA